MLRSSPGRPRRRWTETVPRPLPRRFFQRPTPDVARDLLGCEVWLRRDGGPLRRGRIVEVEAYRGFGDRACHGWRGETPRLRTLFGPGGYAFVYITYGIHTMLNFVTEGPDYPSAVLIRALEPVRHLTGPARGPGLLTRALGVSRADDGGDLRNGPIRAMPGTLRPGERVATSTRVGVDYAGRESAALPWRFFIAGSAHLSRGRPTDPERAAQLLARREALLEAMASRDTQSGPRDPPVNSEGVR